MDELTRAVKLYAMRRAFSCSVKGHAPRNETPKFTHFVSLRIVSPEVYSNVREVQDVLIRHEPRLRSCLVPPSKLHVTMGLLTLHSQNSIEKAGDAVEEAAARAPSRVAVVLPGLDLFRSSVLYARIEETETPGALAAISMDLEAGIAARGLRQSRQPAFIPHATICKLSKWKPSRGAKGKEKRRPKIEEAHIQSLRATPLGNVEFSCLQLLEMKGDGSGFYPVVATVPLGGRSTDYRLHDA